MTNKEVKILKPESQPSDFLEKLDDLIKLEEHVQKRASMIAGNNYIDEYESKETKDINAALAKAQGEFPKIGSNCENPYFKSAYTDLDRIMHAIRPSLNKNGLSITQQTIISKEGATILSTKLRHTTGQFIETRARILPAKNDAQTYGSTLSYMKRYSTMSLLNITVSKDPSDDDAEVQMVGARNIIAKGPSNKYNPRQQSHETVTKEQLEELEYELAEYPDIAEEVLDKMKLQSLADMPKNKFQVAAQRIREIKNIRNGIVKK